jgi:hypothetical protein
MKFGTRRTLGIAVLLGCAALAAACKDDSPTANHDGPVMAADFSLEDLNDSSQTYQQAISPRDYLGSVSAWYFGRST